MHMRTYIRGFIHTYTALHTYLLAGRQLGSHAHKHTHARERAET